jgi:hypothetical protein
MSSEWALAAALAGGLALALLVLIKVEQVDKRRIPTFVLGLRG